MPISCLEKTIYLKVFKELIKAECRYLGNIEAAPGLLRGFTWSAVCTDISSTCHVVPMQVAL